MPETFSRPDGKLHVESLCLAEIAKRFGTPSYVYSQAAIEQCWHQWATALDGRRHLICYAVKANSNLAILALLAKLGAGFDIVSGGELQRVLAAGGNPQKVVFSGVGKSAPELEFALRTGLKGIHIESTEELQRLAALAEHLGIVAPVAVRVRPEVDADTHRHIATGHIDSKFGLDLQHSIAALEYASEHDWLQPVGLACHIGSQLVTAEPFLLAAEFISAMLKKIDGIGLRYLDLGGGLGISYHNEAPPAIAELTAAISSKLPQDMELVLEPGRSMVAAAGVLLTKVEYLKHGRQRNFAVVDAGMNDFMRPTMYGAWHRIEPLHCAAGSGKTYDVVGPVCESGDCFGKDRKLAINADDFLAIMDTGAYGASMSCEYNSRPRPCELLVDDTTVHQIRARGSVAAMLQPEQIPEMLRP